MRYNKGDIVEVYLNGLLSTRLGAKYEVTDALPPHRYSMSKTSYYSYIGDDGVNYTVTDDLFEGVTTLHSRFVPFPPVLIPNPNSTGVPVGVNPYSIPAMFSGISLEDWDMPEINLVDYTKLKCVCGAKACGAKDDDLNRHDNWCDLVTKKKSA